jgi:hypothetical protein
LYKRFIRPVNGGQVAGGVNLSSLIPCHLISGSFLNRNETIMKETVVRRKAEELCDRFIISFNLLSRNNN